MDLGAVGLGGLVGSEAGFASLASDPETKQKWYGSGFLKQERSGNVEDDWRSSKLAKTDDVSAASKAMLLQHRNTLLRSNATLFSDSQQNQPQMLSFSSPKSEPLLLEKSSNSLNPTLPYSYHPLSSYNRHTGYSSGSMLGVVTSTRGPFTPSQWMELEHQALIYKCFVANVPVPTHLLIPIKKALDSAGFCNYSSGLLRPNALGWGAFHLGFSNNTDPEPGRCRRTDGKKWRCSRDAVVDQKYCERHMNRGRHRSRKPVEGQSGHAVAGTTTTTTTATKTNAASKLISNNVSSAVSLLVPGTTASNSLNFSHQDAKNLHAFASNASAAANTVSRMFVNNKDNVSERMQEATALPMLPPTLELKPKESPFVIHKNEVTFEESSRYEFGLVTSVSLLNPSQKSSSLLSSKSFGSTPTERETESQQSLRHFIDDWPKNHSDRSVISWPELDMQSERTQLSISIPMTCSDFMSSTSSPTNQKVTLSPLRLSSRELDPIQMGLGVGSALNESNTRQANWIPITWESSMGGPLGEVLHLSNNNSSECSKNTSALNLVSDGWDNSPPLGSSPTGVLQKTAFGSLSNSSTGSSPRAENKSNDLLVSTLANSTSFPAV